jgi:hypothetical protein
MKRLFKIENTVDALHNDVLLAICDFSLDQGYSHTFADRTQRRGGDTVSVDTTRHTCHTVLVSHQRWPKLPGNASYSHRVVRFQVIQVSLTFRKFYIPELVDQQGTPSHWPVQEFHLHHRAQWRGQV